MTNRTKSTFPCFFSSLLVTFAMISLSGFAQDTPTATPSESSNSTVEGSVKEKKSALDGSQVKDWKPLRGSWVVAQFGGDGEVTIKDNNATIGYGDPLSGIRWEGEMPLENYEVALEARRMEGYDFFCGLTFPVGENSVSLILGGWGGGVLGISSIDGNDASENETSQFRNFDNKKWFRVRVRVTKDAIACWVDDEQVVDQKREGHSFDIRGEMEQCVPLGVAAFQCDSEIRNMKIRKLTPQDLTESKKKESAPSSAKSSNAESSNANASRAESGKPSQSNEEQK